MSERCVIAPEHLYVRTADIVFGNLWRLLPVINVDKTMDIPRDWPGVMGVPITFMDKYNPEQFQIIDLPSHIRLESGRQPYRRLMIRNLHPALPGEIDLAELFSRFEQKVEVEFCAPEDIPEDAITLYRSRDDSPVVTTCGEEAGS